MAASKKSFADGFTVDSLIGGSDMPPHISSQANTGASSTSRGSGQGFRGSPTLYSVNRGEKVLSEDAGGKDIYPPVYGGGKRQITITTRNRGAARGGYKPSSGDLTSGPNPF